MEEPVVNGRRRSKGADAVARSSALERLKALRGGRRSEFGFQIKVEEPIYDTVAEEDYAALVAKRREAAQEFIVDDDGLGYKDEGEEEDWAHTNLSFSSDESESERPRKKKSSLASTREPPAKKPSASTASLSAAAALMGKQRLSSMFTSSIYKRKGENRVKGSAAESIVDDVIAEFAPDEADRERRRRSLPSAIKKPNGIVQVKYKVKPEYAHSSVTSGPLFMEKESLREDSDLNDGKTMELHKDKTLESEVVPDQIPDPSVCSTKTVITAEESKHDDVKGPKDNEAKVQIGQKEEFCALNAKIKVEEHAVPSAAAGWKEVCKVKKESLNGGLNGGVESNLTGEGASDFVLDSDGSLPFYMIDAHEEANEANLGTLYLFGKVKAGSSYQSCCVVVKNLQRCVYAIPSDSVFQSVEIMELERNAENSKSSSTVFWSKLREMASGLKEEIKTKLLDLNVSTFSLAPVKRHYAFERQDIPIGEQYVLKINYPFKDSPLPSDLKGEHFSALLGTHTSALELFIVKRKIKGPSWLSIPKFLCTPSSQRVSWCKFEVTVDSPKDVCVYTSSQTVLEIPPVIVSAINLKTVINDKNNVNEVVSASVICCHKAKIDSPMVASEWKRPGVLTHFTVVRNLEGGIFPMGFSKEVTDRNSRAGSNILASETSERALLSRLMIEIHKLDSDVLVGHNISGFDLDVLLHRAQACKLPSRMWSKIGRLRRTVMPKLTKGSSFFGLGASPGIMACISGRLLCDTYLCSRDLLKEVSYSLTQLSKTQLNKERKEIAPHEIPNMFQETKTLLQLIEYGEIDAWLSLELMFHLSVLPLTRQLTNISGNLWGKTLQGARAQRVEYLLLHEFHAKKYILPDKIFARAKESNVPKRKVNSNEGANADGLNVDVDFENDGLHIVHSKGKKGPAYLGGLVLEPKKGLYDKYILLLDFNSLYPSIIQEYNICFTTVERYSDGSMPSLPSSKTMGILPKLLKILVERRRKVKEWLKTSSGLKAQQFDIQQQALKLTANSIYGCLGFSNSRFYAKPLAELITLQGREILQSTVDLVQNNMNLEVIYGDTDSIMIYTGLDDISKARTIAGKVIQEVNKKYRCLEIDLDGLYKRMLLLKKKKYAAVKVQFKDGTPYEIIERKGLDMVRRDWSLLSKELGDYCLRQILSGGACEEVVESIHNSLMKVQEEMRKGEVELEKYVITKTLTKPPEDYPDAKNQPHVQVALRLKQSGYSTGCSAGDTVSYVICCQQGTPAGSATGIAQRARHPDELKRDHGDWMIDIDYYLSQQIHPVVSRLCACIQGTSSARLADCLGLDSSKFKNQSTEAGNKDTSSDLLGVVDDEERYRGCEPFWLSCPSCSCAFECPPIASVMFSSNQENQVDPHTEKVSSCFWHRFSCPKCPDEGGEGRISPGMIANQVKMQAEKFISMYYTGLMKCDDEMCNYTTRTLNLRVIGDSERGAICPNYPRCNGHLIRQYTEADLYKQLSYMCHLLDAVRCVEKLDYSARIPFEKELARIRPAVDLAASIIKTMRDRCSYGWVQMKDFCVSV
ncbi:DNA polymerase alpha catalytic subunit [Aristolochia californica]|uniref:DNA polymerase alpha catalytic subunit n=1 Tax=Aristolochia californica TaxID=171875 RepID=UPI0035D8B7C2